MPPKKKSHMLESGLTPEAIRAKANQKIIAKTTRRISRRSWETFL